MHTTESVELNELYAALEAFSNEANFAVNVGNYLTRKSANLVLSIRKGLKQLITWDFPLMEDLEPGTTSFYLSKGVDYTTHSEMPVGKPFGLKVEMVDYTTVLLSRAVVLNEIVDRTIEGCINIVGSYINDPTLRAERRFNVSISPTADLEQLRKEESKYFLNTRQADGLFKDLYNSFQDFITSERNMLELRARIEDGRLEKVKAKVENLNLLSETLIKALDDKNAEVKPSREFVKHLGEKLLETAKWIEYYSIQMSRIVETNNVLHSTEKELRKL